MDDITKQAVRLLVDAVEENDEGNATFSGSESIKISDSLVPEVIEAIDIDDDSLRISKDRIELELREAFLNCKGESDIIEKFQSELNDIESKLRSEDTERYLICFPLNFHHHSRGLLPEEIRIDDVSFTRVDRSLWKREYIPSSDDIPEDVEIKMGSPEHMIQKLESFLDRSPNEITNLQYTYWEAEYYSRDRKYAVNAVADRLQILCGQINFAMQYNQTQGISAGSGPWPQRWSDLRSPFIYLIFDDSPEFLEYYYDNEDPTPRRAEKPHSMREDLFKDVFSTLPNFTDSTPLDEYLKKGFKSYQTAITNPSDREGFFAFWRAIEILSLSGPEDPSKVAVDRAEALFDWKNPDLVELRTHRAIRKRNEHVHDGQISEVRRHDKNMVKLLVDGLIDHYIERRGNWNVSQMEFSLEYLTTNIDRLGQLVENREQELEVLDWMEEISQE